MTRVLIHEPHPEVRAFLVRLIEHLGYEAVICGLEVEAPDGEILFLDTGSDAALELARTLRRAIPSLPLVCAGNELPSDGVLALEPVAVLVKPFTVVECERALERAGRSRPRACREMSLLLHSRRSIKSARFGGV